MSDFWAGLGLSDADVPPTDKLKEAVATATQSNDAGASPAKPKAAAKPPGGTAAAEKTGKEAEAPKKDTTAANDALKQLGLSEADTPPVPPEADPKLAELGVAQASPGSPTPEAETPAPPLPAAPQLQKATAVAQATPAPKIQAVDQKGDIGQGNSLTDLHHMEEGQTDRTTAPDKTSPDACAKIGEIMKKTGMGLMDVLQGAAYGYAGITKDTRLEASVKAERTAKEAALDRGAQMQLANLQMQHDSRQQKIQNDFQANLAGAKNQWDVDAAKKQMAFESGENEKTRANELAKAKLEIETMFKRMGYNAANPWEFVTGRAK
jgi:hypothetical protein